jgi:hypothetical protein
MALSMEEERILTEIASQLSDDDPALARRLARFGRDRRRRQVRPAVVIAVTAAVIAAAAAAVAVVILVA